MTGPVHCLDIDISFGHCDPAGIVYYPNHMRWFDRCFHAYLAQRAGGHAALCARLDAVGLGLMDMGARFLAPAYDGDRMRLEMRFAEWSRRALRIEYTGLIKGQTTIEGFEVRGLFVQRDGRMRAGDMRAVQDILAP